MPPPPAPETGSPAPAADTGPQRWEVARQWRLAWRALKWTVFGALIAAALVVVGQVYLFYSLFADLHPLLGYGFAALVTAAFVWLVILPTVRFLRVPAVTRPPDIDLTSPEIDADAIARRLRFDITYLRALVANPELAAQKPDAEAALADARALPLNVDALAAFERTRIEPLLAALDKRVDRYIHAESSAVGAATAISMNGSIDAFIVLWRNVNMVSRIARLYYGRPSLRASLIVLRDVAGAVVLSRALDDVSDMAGEALGGILGKLGGMVAGPLMDGSVNALVTLKIGYLAKRRCRSFEAWSPKRKANVVVEVFKQLGAESASVTADLVKTCEGLGSAAATASAKVFAAPRSAWALVQNLVARRPQTGGVPVTEDE